MSRYPFQPAHPAYRGGNITAWQPGPGTANTFGWPPLPALTAARRSTVDCWVEASPKPNITMWMTTLGFGCASIQSTMSLAVCNRSCSGRFVGIQMRTGIVLSGQLFRARISGERRSHMPRRRKVLRASRITFPTHFSLHAPARRTPCTCVVGAIASRIIFFVAQIGARLRGVFASSTCSRTNCASAGRENNRPGVLMKCGEILQRNFAFTLS